MGQTTSGKQGGILKGKKHSECDDDGCGIKAVVDGTKKIELEGGESIINAKAMQDPEVMTVTGTKKEIASKINSDKGYGVKFEEGGEVKPSFKSGGEVSDNKETYKKWRSLVNMSYSELKRFYDSEEGKKAGLKLTEAKAEGIDYGRESARWILKMKKTPVKDWTPAMWKWANKQISFISRMSGNKGGLYDENGNKTRKHLSLLIWGHNPEKYNLGGEVNKETKMDKPKNNVALYTRVKGEKQFKASDFKGNQVDRLVNAPLVSPDKFDEFLKAVKDTAEQNKGVDFRIKEFGTNKIWYDSQLSKGTEVELEHKDTIEKIASGKLSPEEGAKEIAKDHIAEDPQYYSKLEEMEDIIDGEPQKEVITKLGEDFKVSRSWVDESGSYTNDPSKRAKVLIRVSHKADVMVLFYPSLAYPKKVTNSEAVDVFIKDKNIKRAMIYNPDTIESLKEAIDIAKEQNVADNEVYKIQRNYFQNTISEDPSKLTDFLEVINELPKKQRFDFAYELRTSEDDYGDQAYFKKFLKNVEEKNINIYDLLPESFKKSVKVKRIDFTPSPNSDGLAKITDMFTDYDDLRPSLMGTYFDKENNLIACTNAHILLLISAIPDVEHSSICLMGDKVKYYNKAREKNIESYNKSKHKSNPNPLDEVSKNDDGCWELVSQKYPQYLNVIAREYPNVMDIDVEKISTYLKTNGEHLASTITKQINIGYVDVDGDKVVMGANAFLMLDCIKAMQMLGHKNLDFCHGGGSNRAFTIVPNGNSRKIANNSITTDLALCMPVMIRDQKDYEPIYDLTDNTIKTVAQFYGREVKQEEIAPEPIVEPTPIEVVDPIEPVEDVSVLIGKSLNIYPLGSSDPIVTKITDAKISGKEFTHRTITLTTANGGEERVPAEKYSDLVSGKEIELSDSTGEPYLIEVFESSSQIVTEESAESKEIKDTIDGLEILKSLAKTKKEKKEIQDTIDGLNILLEMPETFGLGGVVDRYKDFDLNEDGDFFAIVNGKEYKIIYRDDKTQLYDLFENGKKIKSSKNVREVMSF